jgi:hypothetical protein
LIAVQEEPGSEIQFVWRVWYQSAPFSAVSSARAERFNSAAIVAEV